MNAAVWALVASLAVTGDGPGPEIDADTDSYIAENSLSSVPTPASPSGSQGTGSTAADDRPTCATATYGEDCRETSQCVPNEGSETGYLLIIVGPAPEPGVRGQVSLGTCEPSDVASAQPSLPALVMRAFREVPVPEPRLSIQPPKGKTLVGLETIFSTEADEFTRTLRLLGQRVELRIAPDHYVWSHGDGTTKRTDWPGRPWSRSQPDIDGYLTHEYEHVGVRSASVEVTWAATYRVNGGPWQAVGATVTRQSPATELRVVEAEPVLNGY